MFGQSSSGAWSGVNTITAGGLLTTNTNTPIVSGNIAAPAGFIVNESANEGFLGYVMPTGDVMGHGNGIADILVGSNDGTNRGDGHVWVIKGMSNTAWQNYNDGTDPVTGPFTLSHMISNGEAFKITESCQFGSGVAIGDINGDGVGDLIIGDIDWGGGCTSSGAYGSAFVIFGGPSLGTMNLHTTALTGSNGFRIDCPSSAESNDYGCGFIQGVGDINDDGVTDLVIGDYEGNVTPGNDEGYAYGLYGSKTAGYFGSVFQLSTTY